MIGRIRFSRYSLVITAVIFLALFVGCFVTLQDRTAFWVWVSLYVIMLVFALLYAPVCIKADSDFVIMRSPLRSRRIPVRNIESVELFRPTMGAKRIIGSGGFMGYWGIFREGDIGRYYAFYGKASDCFLIRLTNGDKYLLGCENPAAMTAFIKSLIR